MKSPTYGEIPLSMANYYDKAVVLKYEERMII